MWEGLLLLRKLPEVQLERSQTTLFLLHFGSGKRYLLFSKKNDFIYVKITIYIFFHNTLFKFSFFRVEKSIKKFYNCDMYAYFKRRFLIRHCSLKKRTYHLTGPDVNKCLKEIKIVKETRTTCYRCATWETILLINHVEMIIIIWILCRFVDRE